MITTNANVATDAANCKYTLSLHKIPCESPKTVNLALKEAYDDLQILTKATAQKSVPPFIAVIEDGVKTLRINPTFAEFARMLSFTFKI